MAETNTFITGDGCRIAYQIDGDPGSPTLVLSNSIATTMHMWDDQVAAFAQAFRVVRYDTRGHGQSAAPQGPYSLERLGRDVLELFDEIGIERAHFCGLSLGGFVGQWLGAHAPERLERLVLSNTSPYLGGASEWDELIEEVLKERNMSAMANMFMSNWFPPQMLTERPDIVQVFRKMVMATAPEGLAGCFAVVRDADLRRSNTTITIPTLVIAGIDDTVTLASHGTEIADAIPAATIVIMPGVHMLNVEHQEEFVKTVETFLE